MRDYSFGNRLYTLRTQAGLSQTQLGKLIHLSNKAVSKWENGTAKPTTDALKKLSQVFHVPIEELLCLRENRAEASIKKIVITGGPCAGKTTALSWIQNNLTKIGYTVLFVPETATELISGGVAPWTCGSNLEYQQCQISLQQAKEAVFEQAAKTMRAEKILIVCDRGLMDNKAYMTELEFQCVLHEMHTSEVAMRDRYDAVFHLVTAAKGAEEFYTRANNTARTETVEQAAALDDRLIAAWTGHPHFRLVGNTTDFERKMQRLIAEITAFLGEPAPYEIERKFLIQYPNISYLASLPNCRRVEIIQTYLKSDGGRELRIRQRGADGSYAYYQTEKIRITDQKRVEIEKRLTQEEYVRLLMDADTGRRQIRKTRYCLMEQDHYYEIDVYPFWTDKAILEIELRQENEDVGFPAFLHCIKEVTGDPAYSNYTLACTQV